MKHFHISSFLLGLASGIVVLLLIAGGMRLAAGPGSASRAVPAFNDGNGQQFQGGGFNAARMAERLGMTEEELQRELASGKTFQQIAEERGVELPARGMQRNPSTASGSLSSAALSSLPSPQP